jgi:hypothetical protein
LTAAPSPEKQQELLGEIETFIARAKGLESRILEGGSLRIIQAIDKKCVDLKVKDLEAVLSRSDTEGQEFLQVNFCSGKKILITTTLIGFKPVPLRGLDLAKLPRVVTTPDVVSIFEAIQDALHALDTDTHEISVLKRVYEAVLAGGESVGFDLGKERRWVARIPATLTKTSA